MEIKKTKIYEYLEKNNKTFYCENINKVTVFAKSILSRIPAMFSNYTNHDIGHSARVADYMVELLPCPIERYNDLELVIMLYSAIFHDIGMAVSETEDNLDSSKQDNIRKTHHIRSEKFIKEENGIDECFAIDNESSVSFKNLIALIIRAHGEDFSWIGNNLRQNEYFGNDAVNPQFISCLLRLGDYLDFDSRRAPYHLFQFLDFSTRSFDEWKKHYSITNYKKIDNQKIFFTGNCEEPDVFIGILHYFDLIEMEIKNAKSMLFCNAEKYRLNIENKISNQISHNSFDSVDLQFLMDYIPISNLLMGENLYYDRKSALREIVQNSLDAVSLKKEISKKIGNDYIPTIKIIIENDTISIKDNGIGMALSDIKKYFLNIGHSFYRSSDFKALSLSYKPISHYGIGFLSSFLLSDVIIVKTASYKEPNVCTILQLQKNSRFVIQKKEENSIPDSGTEIMFDKSSFTKIFPKREDICKYISETFKDTGIKIVVSENGQELSITFESQNMKNRISISEYLDNVECSCTLPFIAATKSTIKLRGISSITSPFEDANGYLYDAEFFPEMIVDEEVLYNWAKNEQSIYSIERLLNSDGGLQVLSIYPLDCDESENFFQAQEILDDNDSAFEYLQKKYFLYEPIRIYISDENLFSDFEDFDIIDMDSNIKGCSETSVFKKLLISFIEKRENYDVRNCLVKRELQSIFINDVFFSKVELNRTVTNYNHNNLFIKNVRVPNFNITIPILLRGIVLTNFDINIFLDNCYPDVSRTRVNEETSKALGYAIGRAIHIFILEHADLKESEKNFLREFIKEFYGYDSKNEFCNRNVL